MPLVLLLSLLLALLLALSLSLTLAGVQPDMYLGAIVQYQRRPCQQGFTDEQRAFGIGGFPQRARQVQHQPVQVGSDFQALHQSCGLLFKDEPGLPVGRPGHALPQFCGKIRRARKPFTELLDDERIARLPGDDKRRRRLGAVFRAGHAQCYRLSGKARSEAAPVNGLTGEADGAVHRLQLQLAGV